MVIEEVVGEDLLPNPERDMFFARNLGLHFRQRLAKFH
jgi:hypothetical protein